MHVIIHGHLRGGGISFSNNGKFGKSLNRDASNKFYLSAIEDKFTNFTHNDYTVDFWWKLPTSGLVGDYTPGWSIAIVAASNPSVGSGYWQINFTEDRLTVGRHAVADDVYLFYQSSNYRDDEFHHFALVKNGTIYSLYIDGILSDQKNSSTVIDCNSNLVLFGSASFGGLYGQFDELRISNTVRYNSNFTPENRPYTPFIDCNRLLNLFALDDNS